jgi:hypothetical protein
MAIRINLLAEAQIAEEMRRRDPVKLAIYTGVLLVVVLLVWSSALQVEVAFAKGDLNNVQREIESKTNDYQHALVNLGKINESKKKLEELQKLTNSRFLQGDFLNALQEATVDDVQLARVRVDQSYFRIEGSSGQTNDGRIVIGRPATVTEKIVVTLDARDSSATPGDQLKKFKEVIASQSYFKAMLNKTNGVQLINTSPLETGMDGKPYVLFTLECDFPEQTR